MPPRVSVIIPTFNQPGFLVSAIQSVLDQTYQDFEIIIVDDGSLGESLDVISQFQGAPIRYIYQPNKGSGGARNTGILASQGDYIAFLDDDDWYLPQKLQLQAGYLDAHPDIDLVTGGWLTESDAGEVIRTDRPWQVYPAIDLELLFFRNPIVVHAILVRRACLERVSYFDETLRWVEDWDLWLRLALNGSKMAWTPEVVCKRRIHGVNKSRDALRMREGILRTLDKNLASSLLPANLLEKQAVILAQAYLLAAVSGYAVAGLEEQARIDLAQAIQLDASLLTGHLPPICLALAEYSLNIRVEDSLTYLKHAFMNLPFEASGLKRCWRRTVAQAAMQQVFINHQLGQRSTVRKALIQALWYNLAWLMHDGVLSIAVEAWLGPAFAQEARKVMRRK